MTSSGVLVAVTVVPALVEVVDALFGIVLAAAALVAPVLFDIFGEEGGGGARAPRGAEQPGD